jgi:hypothetical protein
MAYLNCGRCGLEIKIQAAYLRMDNCPRCLARGAIAAPMTVSARGVTHAVGWGAPAPEHHSAPRGPGKPFPTPIDAARRSP